MSLCLPFVDDEVDIVEAYLAHNTTSAHQPLLGPQARRLRRQLRRRKQDHGTAAGRKGHLSRDRSWRRKSVKVRIQHLHRELLLAQLAGESIEDLAWQWENPYGYEQLGDFSMPALDLDPFDSEPSLADDASFTGFSDDFVDDYPLEDFWRREGYVLPACWTPYLDALW